MATFKECLKKDSFEKFWMVPTWKTKKEKTSKFVDAGCYNRNKRAGKLATWNGSTERDGEKKNFRHNKM